MEKSIYSEIKQSLPKPLISVDPKDLEALKRVGEVALAIIATAGVATIAIAAPNVLQAIGKLFLNKKSRRLSQKEKETKTLQTFYYLKRSGFIEFKRDKKGFKIFVTKKGEDKLQKMSLEILRIQKQAKWDGRWWQVAADIPTKYYRQGADLLRQKIKDMGFYSLQRTLWFYPFDPRKEIQFITETYGINNFVTVMEISAMDKEDENKLLDFFKKSGIL